MRIVHLISALYQGGAESQLEQLIYTSKISEVEHIVISLKNDETPLMIRLRTNGIKVYSVGLSGLNVCLAFVKLLNLFRKLDSSSTVFQCWMYHANFFGLFAAIPLGITNKIIWNIRRTEVPNGATGLLSKLSAKLSYLFPIHIVCCADAVKKSHVEAGYHEKKMVVIHNGIDSNLFKPNDDIRADLRARLDIKDNDFVIGMIGRYAPIKGHLNFLKAVRQMLLISDIKNSRLKIVLIGRGVKEAEALQCYFKSPDLKNTITILDEQSGIWNLLPGFDLLCLPSISEGFPNVVVESMACGIPAIVTDVGEAALIVNNSDLVVPAQEPDILASCLLNFIRTPLSYKELTAFEARERVELCFSIERAWGQYHALYQKLMGSY